MRNHLAGILLVAALSVGADPMPPTLRSGLANPFPGGTMAGYAGDTGLDISGVKKPVFALASGNVDYSEWGHTLWRGPKDTAFCIRVELDKPIPFSDGRIHGKITHVYYAHLSALEFTQTEQTIQRRHVVAGEKLGTSGIANGSPHLHVGLLLDGQVEQDDWKFILTEAEVRKVLGDYKPGDRI
jgi:murein DD-endopeptidase MepM/ murein hydrolase activator NlpD